MSVNNQYIDRYKRPLQEYSFFSGDNTTLFEADDEEDTDNMGKNDDNNINNNENFEDIEMEEDNVEEDNVVDVTDLTTAQKETKGEVAQLAQSFSQLTQLSTKLTQILDKMNTRVEQQENKLETIKNEIEKRIPTPTEKLMIRSADSYPYNVPITDYWKKRSQKDDKYAIDINNDTKKPSEEEYVLRKSDIDQWHDTVAYESFNKNLRDIIGF